MAAARAQIHDLVCFDVSLGEDLRGGVEFSSRHGGRTVRVALGVEDGSSESDHITVGVSLPIDNNTIHQGGAFLRAGGDVLSFITQILWPAMALLPCRPKRPYGVPGSPAEFGPLQEPALKSG
eukprot:TRINITY_DN29033_c0_g1_i2.p1 TRINITY_DN29033_c0_g1~~TRINITY_DN29033_c0_g1_i2.p1  ORF type:complete len:123 (-),score=19.62 TRINITY_DN29033_c0_g1_i2:104-472(-)